MSSGTPARRAGVTHLQVEPTTRCNFVCGFCCGRAMDQSDLSFEAFEQMLARFPDLERLELHGEGEAQEGADEHDEPEHGDPAQRGLLADCADDVGGDEQLQPEQDGAADLLPEAAEGVLTSPGSVPDRHQHERYERADHHDRHARALEEEC